MLYASKMYKEEMEKDFRNRTYMSVSLGIINHKAQSNSKITDTEQYAYYSNFQRLLDNYDTDELYATTDEDFSSVDGTMYFMPRKKEDIILNQGVVSKDLLGSILIHFAIPYEIKGLTIDFGKSYPEAFLIESNQARIEVRKNTNSIYICEDIFREATYIKITALKMKNGSCRLRISKITMGIGVYFDSEKILSSTKKEFISPIMENLPTLDFSLTVNNKDRLYDIENDKSSVHFLNVGQEISIHYGQELDDGSIEWLRCATAYLREWSADDAQMSFIASDRFDDMNQIYLKGRYYEKGITLYELAKDVLEDANIDVREYWIDSYLKKIIVHNPMPPISHKEALQLIANASRCVLGQDVYGKIFIKSSFLPDMQVSSDHATYYSNMSNILKQKNKEHYASTSHNYTLSNLEYFFLPKKNVQNFTGYISEEVANAEGVFKVNPKLKISLESSIKIYSFSLYFHINYPEKIILHTFLDDKEVENITITDTHLETYINREFEEFDELEIEFVKGFPNNRIVLDHVHFGENTDYKLRYSKELTKTPKGTQLQKIKNITVSLNTYVKSSELKEITKEKIFVNGIKKRVFRFYNASCDYEVSSNHAEVSILKSSAYFLEVEIRGDGECEIVVKGYEYFVNKNSITKTLSYNGKEEIWENPLISDINHANDVAEWIGKHLKSDRDYEITYRGEPRIMTNDSLFLENKYVDNLMLRVYDHTLYFNGGLSGTMRARRDFEYVAES